MKILKKAWKWLNNKKTAIGFIGVQFCLTGFAKTHIDTNTLELMNLGFTALGGVGVVHKVQKSDVAKKFTDNLKKRTGKNGR